MHKIKNKKWSTNTLLCIFLFILFLGIALFFRVWRFGSVPVSLYIDEVAMRADAQAFIAQGTDLHGKSWLQPLFLSYGDYKMPVYLWCVFIFSKIFGVSDVVTRLPSLLAGLLTLGIVFLLTQNFLKKWQRKKNQSKLPIALSAIIVVGFSPWAIQFARTGFEAHVAQMFLGASVLLLCISEKRWKYLISSVVLALLATYAYFSVRYVWIPVYLVWALTELGSHTYNSQKELLWSMVKRAFSLLIPLFLYGIFLLPMVKSPLYEASMQFRLSTPSILQNSQQVIEANRYREFSGNTLLDRVLFHRWYFTAQALGENMSTQLSPKFLFISGDQNLRHGTGRYGLFLFPFIFPAVLGVYVLARRNKGTLLLLGTWIIAAAIPAAVPLEVPHALRFLNALIPLSVFITVGLAEGVRWMLNQKKMQYFYRGILAVYIVSVFFFVSSFGYEYFLVYPTQSSTSWEENKSLLITKLQPTLKDTQTPLYLLGMPDKYFLWVLAYGPYDFKEMSSWTVEEHHFTQISNVFFELPSNFDEKSRIVVEGNTWDTIKSYPLFEEKKLQILEEHILSEGNLYYTIEVIPN